MPLRVAMNHWTNYHHESRVHCNFSIVCSARAEKIFISAHSLERQTWSWLQIWSIFKLQITSHSFESALCTAHRGSILQSLNVLRICHGKNFGQWTHQKSIISKESTRNQHAPSVISPFTRDSWFLWIQSNLMKMLFTPVASANVGPEPESHYVCSPEVEVRTYVTP